MSVGIIDKTLKCWKTGKKNSLGYQNNKYYWTGAWTL